MRNEKTIELEDRGNKLTFKIREMSATQLEDWTMRAVLVLAGAGSDIPAGGGVEGIGKYLAEHGLAAIGNVDYQKAKPLLDEMLGCCSRVVDRMEEKVTPETADAYISDMSTLFKLRLEAFKVNFSFFGNGVPSSSPEKASTVRVSAR
jgi:hypothetical protein